MMNAILHPLARFLVALIFLLSGVGKMFSFVDTSAMMAGKGFPVPSLFLIGAIFLEIVGGLSVLLGFKIRIGVILLIVFLIPATLIFHIPGLPEQSEINNVMKNIAIIGALIKFFVDGAGAYSLDENNTDLA